MRKFSYSLIIIFIFLFGFSGITQAATSVPRKVLAFSEMFGINVFWGRLNLEETEKIVLIRKKDACPQNSLDGEIIYEGNGSGYLDKDAASRKNYCYGIFITDISGRKSALITTVVVKKLNLWQYFSRSTQENRVIFWGGVVVVILMVLNLVKKRKHARNILVGK